MSRQTKRSNFFSWLLYIFAILYACALALFLVGMLGLFRSEQGPLAGIFLIPLGLPWNRVLDFAWLTDPGRIWLTVLAPLINILVLWLIRSRFRPQSNTA